MGSGEQKSTGVVTSGAKKVTGAVYPLPKGTLNEVFDCAFISCGDDEAVALVKIGAVFLPICRECLEDRSGAS